MQEVGLCAGALDLAADCAGVQAICGTLPGGVVCFVPENSEKGEVKFPVFAFSHCKGMARPLGSFAQTGMEPVLVSGEAVMFKPVILCPNCMGKLWLPPSCTPGHLLGSRFQLQDAGGTWSVCRRKQLPRPQNESISVLLVLAAFLRQIYPLDRESPGGWLES